MVGDSFLDPSSYVKIMGDPKKIFDEETIWDNIGECKTYGKMVKALIKCMKECASSLFQVVKVTYAKANHIQQNIQKELTTLMEQKKFQREIDANLVEIKGMERYSQSSEVNHRWRRRENWHMVGNHQMKEW